MPGETLLRIYEPAEARATLLARKPVGDVTLTPTLAEFSREAGTQYTINGVHLSALGNRYVAQIAVELGGGGHSRASAALIREIPLAEVLFDFYDRLKSITQGYGSFDWEMIDYRETDVVKVDILVNSAGIAGPATTNGIRMPSS